MSDLRPILQDDPTEHERWLIASARIDVPAANAKAGVLAALGLPAARTAPAHGAGASPTPLPTAVVVKWVALGAVAGALALGAVRALVPSIEGLARPGPVAPASSSPRPVPHAARVPEMQGPWSVVPTPTPTEPTRDEHPELPALQRRGPDAPATRASRGVSRAPAASDAPVAAPEAPSAASTSTSTLLAEVAALADARRALASGDAAESLRLLDVHDRRFDPPALSAEATILRIEALVAVGRIDEARGLATRFVTAHPDSPYAQRVASLVRAAGDVGSAGADIP